MKNSAKNKKTLGTHSVIHQEKRKEKKTKLYKKVCHCFKKRKKEVKHLEVKIDLENVKKNL